ncbi:MAG: hypothetical protein LBE08_11740 [Bifidobacteriaceae bacterium]|nr:hypothetical protein [Bifidobacteriaceae bacterium]
MKNIKRAIAASSMALTLVGSAILASPALAVDDDGPGLPPSAELTVEVNSPVQPRACNITARSVYASNNMAWTGGTWSGCASPVTVYLRWDHVGPDTNMGQKTNASSGVDYGWGCNWGTPQNRILFGKAVDNNGNYDDSTHNTFTSSTTNCKL